MKNKFLRYLAVSGALLLMLMMASVGAARTIKCFGLTIEVPEGWTVEKDEQITIYNKNQSAAVIVDELPGGQAGSADAVAGNLADGIGVERKNIRRGKGGLSLSFTQGGENVGVRVFEHGGRVLMVYSFGSDPTADQIADSIGNEEKQ